MAHDCPRVREAAENLQCAKLAFGLNRDLIALRSAQEALAEARLAASKRHAEAAARHARRRQIRDALRGEKRADRVSALKAELEAIDGEE